MIQTNINHWILEHSLFKHTDFIGFSWTGRIHQFEFVSQILDLSLTVPLAPFFDPLFAAMFLTGDGHDDDFEGILEKLSVRLVGHADSLVQWLGLPGSDDVFLILGAGGHQKKKKLWLSLSANKPGKKRVIISYTICSLYRCYSFQTSLSQKADWSSTPLKLSLIWVLQCPQPWSPEVTTWSCLAWNQRSAGWDPQIFATSHTYPPKSGSMLTRNHTHEGHVFCIGWLWNRDGIKMYCTPIHYFYIMYILMYVSVWVRETIKPCTTIARFFGAPKLVSISRPYTILFYWGFWVPRSRSIPGFKRSSRPLVAGGVALCQDDRVWNPCIFSTWKINWKLNLTCNLMEN